MNVLYGGQEIAGFHLLCAATDDRHHRSAIQFGSQLDYCRRAEFTLYYFVWKLRHLAITKNQ